MKTTGDDRNPELDGMKIMGHGWKLRTCLKCGRRFRSWGPGNRRCALCQKALDEAQVRGEPPVVRWPRWILPPQRDDEE